MRRKQKLLTIWKLIIALSLCLNAFGGYRIMTKWFTSQPLVKREIAKLLFDGCKYRWGGIK